MRRKGDEENLAEWLVEITVTPDADAGTSFAAAYDRRASALSRIQRRPLAAAATFTIRAR